MSAEDQTASFSMLTSALLSRSDWSKPSKQNQWLLSGAAITLMDDVHGVDIRVIQVLLGHAKLDNTALYTKVATRTVRTVTSPLDKIAGLIGEKAQGDG